MGGGVVTVRMSEFYVNRNGERLVVHIARGGWPKATRVAIKTLGLGESVMPIETHEAGWFEFRVIPPTILTLAEIRNGTGFARGVRFVELPDPSKGRVL